MAAKDMEKQIVEDWNNGESTPVTDYLKKMGCRGNAEHLAIGNFHPLQSGPAITARSHIPKPTSKLVLIRFL